MTYELRAGERGSYTEGGPGSRLVTLGLVLAAGCILSFFAYLSLRGETIYLDPANEYFGLSVLGLILAALFPLVVPICYGTKECIWLRVDDEQQRISISWERYTRPWVESFHLSLAERFELDADPSGNPDKHLFLKLRDGDKFLVAKFAYREDAQRERDAANLALQ